MAPLLILLFSFLLSLSAAEQLPPWERPNVSQLISDAQFIAKVNIIRTNQTTYKAKVRIDCLFKGTTRWTHLKVYGINHPVIRAPLTGRVYAGSEAIIFANTSRNPRKWQLIYGGLTGVWAVPNVTKALKLSADSCPKPGTTSSNDEIMATRIADTFLMGTGSTEMSTPQPSLQQCARAPNDSTKDMCNRILYAWHAFVWDSHVTKTQCDAVVISDLWVLTSARCVQRYTHRAHSLVVSLGVDAASTATKSARATRVVLHPKWQTPSEEHGEYDMALVKFNKPPQRETESYSVRPVCLADVDDTPSYKYKSKQYFCCASATNVPKETVKTIYLKPPSNGKTSLDSDVVGDVYPMDQSRTVWAAPVCEAEDGTLRVFQVLSGTIDFRQKPVSTDVRLPSRS